MTETLGTVSRSTLDGWVRSNTMSVTAVIDRTPMTNRAFAVLGRRETWYIVDLRTMRIARKILGDTSGANSVTILNSTVDATLALLRM
ncbi:MAG: hypothetical protein JNK05_11410 [Myxococcales bacterium]|nr:hypothetical protein [Myxococcales bacterium]